MKRSFRYFMSVLMTAVYLLIILAPLAPAALHCGIIAHAITGECAGDCRICGCSPERSSSGTCCCALKKMAGKREVQAAAGKCSDCNAALKPVKKVVSSCCSAARKASAGLNDECTPPENKSPETAITSLPCGSWKMLAFGGIEILHMPSEFRSSIPCIQSTQEHKPFSDRLTSYRGDPPDPPPKITLS